MLQRPQNVSSILNGIPGYPIEDVKLSNIYIETVGGATAGWLRYNRPSSKRRIRSQECSDPCRHRVLSTACAQCGDESCGYSERDRRRAPAFYLADVERADFFAVTARRGADGAFALHDVKNLRIGWSRAAADATLDRVDNKML